MQRITFAAFCVLLGLATLPGRASAQYRLDRFRSAERADDGFGVKRLGAFGHLQFGVNATVDYANDPLVTSIVSNNDTIGYKKIVSDELLLKVDFSLALWSRLVVLASFDAPLQMKGEKLPVTLLEQEADGAGFGDISLGGRLRIVGDNKKVFGLGVQAVAIIPTSTGDNYSGEPNVAFRPELILDIKPKYVRITGNVGGVFKKDKAELTYGAALGLPLHERFEIVGELNGGIFDPQADGGSDDNSLEWLAGAKVNHPAGVYLGAAAGTSILEAIGAPDYRIVAQIGVLPFVKEEQADAPSGPTDIDSDGVEDPRDLCPREPEDRDQYADDDGCPDADNDGDGVLDIQDRCPLDLEDMDGVMDTDGCPDLDNDGDGIADATDRCPTEAEDKDTFQDEDGCPDPDNDGDGVLDGDDACPLEAGEPSEKGCRPRVSVSAQGEIQFSEQILFEPNKDIILESGQGILSAIAKTLIDKPELNRVRIEGHTDNSGGVALNDKLSRARAKSVAEWLIAHEVAASRLLPVGCGPKHPIADNSTDEGKMKNRRVMFQVIDPVPSEAERAKTPAGCQVVRLKGGAKATVAPAKATAPAAPKAPAASVPATTTPASPGSPKP